MGMGMGWADELDLGLERNVLVVMHFLFCSFVLWK
jgi:hypothetical protein